MATPAWPILSPACAASDRLGASCLHCARRASALSVARGPPCQRALQQRVAGGQPHDLGQAAEPVGLAARKRVRVELQPLNSLLQRYFAREVRLEFAVAQA